LGRLFGGAATMLFDTKSAVRIGDECWILRSFDWSVILRKASHYVIVAEVVIFEEQEVNGQRKLVESQVLDGSLTNSETAWEEIKIM